MIRGLCCVASEAGVVSGELVGRVVSDVTMAPWAENPGGIITAKDATG